MYISLYNTYDINNIIVCTSQIIFSVLILDTIYVVTLLFFNLIARHVNFIIYYYLQQLIELVKQVAR